MRPAQDARREATAARDAADEAQTAADGSKDDDVSTNDAKIASANANILYQIARAAENYDYGTENDEVRDMDGIVAQYEEDNAGTTVLDDVEDCF